MEKGNNGEQRKIVGFRQDAVINRQKYHNEKNEISGKFWFSSWIQSVERQFSKT